MDRTIEDIVCPYCGSFHTQIYGTDELDFSPDCECGDCHKSFRMFYKFKYQITDSYVRK